MDAPPAGRGVRAVGFLAVAVGIAALHPDLHKIGTGTAPMLVGAILSAYGARYDRRFTTWVWALGVGLGAVLVLTDLITGGATLGIALIIAGVVLIAAGRALARALDEPDDIVATTPGSTVATGTRFGQ